MLVDPVEPSHFHDVKAGKYRLGKKITGENMLVDPVEPSHFHHLFSANREICLKVHKQVNVD